MRRWTLVGALALAFGVLVGVAAASTPGADVRLTHDANDPGYVSSYTLATGTPYTDATLAECSRSRGRQNEPAIAVDPRNTNVILGSSNDYCGVYNTNDADGNPIPVGPIWMGYYRSENAGGSFVSSLIPGYPDDTSPYGQIAKQQVRTASAGDPVIAWDAQGRAFFGSESSDDPAGTPKTFGDVWVATYDNPNGPSGNPQNDGKRYRQTFLVNRGSSAPNLLGIFNDKTTIEADHNSDGRCDNNAYFSWSRFSGNAGGVGIYFSRSTNHGVTFSTPKKLSQTISDVQFPDIAVTGNSNIYLVFRSFESGRGPEGNSIYYVKSTDCGATFSRPKLLQNFIENDAQDVGEPEAAPAQSQPDDPGGEEEPEAEGNARDCGDFDAHCESGYTFFRRDTQPRATADQFDTANPDRFYVVYDATKPGTVTSTGTTYGTIESGTAGQAAIFFLRVNGANWSEGGPVADRQRDDRAPGLPGHLGGQSVGRHARHDPHHLVGQPQRRLLQRDAAHRQLRQPDHGALARRVGCQVDELRRELDGDAGEQRHVQPELRAVRRPHRAVRGRLSLRQLRERLLVRRLDGLA